MLLAWRGGERPGWGCESPDGREGWGDDGTEGREGSSWVAWACCCCC